jgi:hypothetical protein
LDCIYLRPTDSAQGGHELLHLQTNRAVTRQNLTAAVVTPTIVKMVHRLTKMDGMPEGLEIKNRTNEVLFDSARIAGVDYDEDLFHDKDYKMNSESDKNEEDDEAEEYDKMDLNEIADITDEPHQFILPNQNNQIQNDVPPIFHNEEEEIIFEDKQENVEEVIIEDDGKDAYEDSKEEDVSLEADKDKITNPTLRRTERVRVPNRKYQHLQTSDD